MNRRTNAILAIAVIMAVLPVCTQAIPMPHGIAGIVYLSDGVTQAPVGTSFNVTDTTSGDYIEGTTGAGPHSGAYSVPIRGEDEDTVIVAACTATHYGTTTVTLVGDMTGVDVILDTPFDSPEPQLCTDPDPPSHDFGSVQQEQTRTWTFDITNCGEGTLTWTVSDDQSWITVSPASGSTTTEADTVTVTIDTTGLTSGTTYDGTITVSSNDGTKTGTISVSIPPDSPEPQLCTDLEPPSHDFGSVQQGQTRTWTFDITNCGEGTLTWTVSDDQSWITVSPASGSTTTETDTVTVTIDTTGLTSGTTYDGTITVGSNDGTKTGTISVSIPPDSPEPQLCTNPDPPSHDFGSVQQGQTRTWTFDITNCGEGTLTWTVSDDQSWITVSPASGSTTTEADTVTVTIDTTGLTSGTTHDGTITVGSNDGTKTGTISVYVSASPPPTPAPTPINYEPVPAITPPGILSLIALLALAGFVVLRRKE